MSAATARLIERCIIWLCVATLIMIFQPFSKLVSAIGLGLVVLDGLIFNLVPLCEPGRSIGSLLKVLLIVAIVFVIVLALAIGSAHLYGLYLAASQADD
jgi:hypothetical protein